MGRINRIAIEDAVATSCQILDVRSPAEFTRGHVPGAINLPLFDDDERALVGTDYKESGRASAIRLGLSRVGPKLADFVAAVDAACGDVRQITLMCWRGGMRSGSMAWLLSTAGYQVHVVEGGYKKYRKWVLAQLGLQRDIRILGGLTGSGKTEVLLAMARLGAQVIDLEGLANHRGSVFGNLLLPPQPTQQQFENELTERLSRTDPNEALWLEDESRHIGRNAIPDGLWMQMRDCSTVFLEVDPEERGRRSLELYGRATGEQLGSCISRLEKTLGQERMRATLALVERGALQDATEQLLAYYDEKYLFGLGKRDPEKVTRLSPPRGSAETRAQWLRDTVCA